MGYWVNSLTVTCRSTQSFIQHCRGLQNHRIIRGKNLTCVRSRGFHSLEKNKCIINRRQTREGYKSAKYFCVLPSYWKQNMMEVQKIREDAVEIFEASVNSVYPPQMIRNAVTLSQDGSMLQVGGKEYRLDRNVYVVGFGKAVSGMAAAVDTLIRDHIVEGVISIPYGSQELFRSIGKDDLCVLPDSKIRVYEGAENNLPDENAHAAAMAIQDLVVKLDRDDLLIVLISGGGSALLPSPVSPLTLKDELEMTRLVSRSGGSIQDLNVLRQNLESLKGGGLAEKAKPASVVSLILSDVIGDKLDIISSGPTNPLLSSPRQCLQILERLNVMDKMPAVIRDTLLEKASRMKTLDERSPYHYSFETFDSQWAHVNNVIIGSNSIATEAASVIAEEKGYVPVVVTNSLTGEAKTASEMFAQLAKYIILTFDDIPPDQGKATLSEAEVGLMKLGLSKVDLKKIEAAATKGNNSKSGVCAICGGETIVNVKGDGKGGRNQEMALAFALEFSKAFDDDKSGIFKRYHVEFLSAGTDGQDGPTDAAGAVVNRYLIPAAISSKLDPGSYLENNDSYNLFSSIKDSKYLLQPGLTGTNVMDIQLLIVQKV